MDLEVYRSSVLAIKPKIINLKESLQTQIQMLQVKEKDFVEIDNAADKIRESKGDNIVILNISGKKYKTKVKTLLNIKDTVFYKMVINGFFDNNNEVFIPESALHFSAILDYLRYSKIELLAFRKEELKSIQESANYFNICKLVEEIYKYLWKPHIMNILFSEYYTSFNNDKIMTNRAIQALEDEEDLTKGLYFVFSYSGWVTFEIDTLTELNTLIIYPYVKSVTDYQTYYMPGPWYISTDGVTWSSLGNISNIYSTTPYRFKLNGKKGKFIKCEFYNNFGLGALGIY